MRTPWRFVADLVSRKPKPESTAVATKTIALEYKPVLEEEQPGTKAAAVDRAAEAVSDAQLEASLHDQDTSSNEIEPAALVAAGAPAAPAGNEEPAARATSHQPEEESPAPTPTKAPEARAQPAPARRKKIEPIVEPVVSTDQTNKLAPNVAASPRSFMDEMADLDAEVDALRRQLAKKLIEQNAQLRKMLNRFNGR